MYIVVNNKVELVSMAQPIQIPLYVLKCQQWLTWILVLMAPMEVMVVKAPPVSQAIFFRATVGRGWGPTA